MFRWALNLRTLNPHHCESECHEAGNPCTCGVTSLPTSSQAPFKPPFPVTLSAGVGVHPPGLFNIWT
ncbi:hypothetical protein EVAR_29324_1 [Eumeta japonica]|uniref:Uncharacterized protein n=1 Tax=Eumeta variegata TaxID=151549 RepID=A0A4C1WKC4_EUMVA|nr:hypothetical protein EVAR_29324_1 [Eumeta japonica]